MIKIKKIRLMMMALATALFVAGCGTVAEDKVRDRNIQVSRTMVNDLIEARTDNRTVSEVGELFGKYINNISSEVWNTWYDIEDENAYYNILIAENEGYYPLDSEVDIIHYGEDSGDGYYYTAVSTMKVKEDYSGREEQIRVYYFFQFDDSGLLVHYDQNSRVIGGTDDEEIL